MLTVSALKRLVGLGTWIALVAISLAFLLRWRGSATSQKVSERLRSTDVNQKQKSAHIARKNAS